MIKTGAQILWECLEQQGVTTVFGYPGGAILPAYDALKYSNIHHVLVRHEQGATHMADGYARASGRVGVAIATSGPGATNMVTGIATAMLDSSPIVCITGQVGSKLIGSDAFQETDITGVTLPITKHNYLVTHASEVAQTISEAFYVAQFRPPRSCAGRHHQGRAAVHVRIRRKAGCAATAGLPSRSFADARGIQTGAGTDSQCQAAGDSGGARHHFVRRDGRSARRSPKSTNIPVGLTLLGLGGFPASHPLSLGMMGMHGEAWLNTTIQEADLLHRFRHAV